MKVILLEDLKSHGLKGDVVEVSEGYARNFLFPQHLAIEASEKTLKDMDTKKKQESAKEKKQSKQEKKLAADIDGFELIIEAKADGGKLYASFGPKDVAKELKANGFKVDAKLIKFNVVKEIGTYETTIEFPSGFEASISIIIESK